MWAIDRRRHEGEVDGHPLRPYLFSSKPQTQEFETLWRVISVLRDINKDHPSTWMGKVTCKGFLCIAHIVFCFSITFFLTSWIKQIFVRTNRSQLRRHFALQSDCTRELGLILMGPFQFGCSTKTYLFSVSAPMAQDFTRIH